MNKKVYVRVFGGIGNQLFIYAFARTLCLKSNYKIFFDIKTGFINDTYGRTFKLTKYISDISIASQKSLILFYFTKFFPKISKLLLQSEILVEKDTRIFLDVFSEINKNNINYFFIQGYFQSYLYFNEFEAQIKADINLDFNKTESVEKIAKQIRASKAISIHVRRVEYCNLLDLNYYLKAMAFMKANIEGLVFYIFSDDLTWCKNNFPNEYSYTFVSHDVQDEVADIWLMTLCQHHIIANSSFSWWGAWLSKNQNKKVIAPLNTDVGVIGSLYPLDWILI